MIGRKHFGVFILAVLCMSLVLSATAHAQIKTEKPLYQRLGGYDAIAAVADDFLGRLIQDETLGRFFTGQSTESKMRIRQLVVDQVCAATGGPCVYIGRDMKSSHAGLGITEEEWNTMVKHLVASLDKFNVAEKEKNELIGAITGMKKDIVEDKKMSQN